MPPEQKGAYDGHLALYVPPLNIPRGSRALYAEDAAAGGSAGAGPMKRQSDLDFCSASKRERRRPPAPSHLRAKKPVFIRRNALYGGDLPMEARSAGAHSGPGGDTLYT